ncbi:MAG: protein-export chaperone SecB [Emcibacter sp.]|nr:protein-export chaperone SecB [Emcibacter sp.]
MKNSSFKSPNSSKIFTKDWKPETSLDLNISHSDVDKGLFEVVLSVAITASNEGMPAFEVEVDQAAIFQIEGFPEQHLLEALGAACPSVMFPYLRETIDHLLIKGGYPPLMIAPINFDALYADTQRKSA